LQTKMVCWTGADVMTGAEVTARRRPTKRGNGEGSIYYQKSRERWAASLSMPGGKRKMLYGRSRQEATQKLHTAMQTQKQGALVVGPRQTLGQFLERWLQDSVKPTNRPRTYETYSEKARLHIVP